ncbi:hypothetical protein FHS82_001708 [Pseudochelatococcus lubricantis]|uniref:Alginate lyase 2 domain-containing protein n=1 Tax=Pseudochelatococcus lubricantis TaxID=1538102 RepID=A0ABX0UY47_9HYPH|nr:polysaccharide lyase family 7 protein [Pseudochelatococcus lubricantis]NIJ57872.1 hypothetical protein [Pseudochelatococcus lubricantis]
MSLIPDVAPGVNFDLTDWKITLPVNSKGSASGKAYEVKNLVNYENSKYFYTADDGAMVFYAPVKGATTSGSKYVRSELREMDNGRVAGWTTDEGGHMAATLEVDQAPIKTNGDAGRLIVGQVHGEDDELVRIYWDNEDIYFINDRAGSKNKETKFQLRDENGDTPDVSLNERFSYRIDVSGDVLDVRVYADGKEYKSITKINKVWQDDELYFKAGAYLGVNSDSGRGAGQVSFYQLDISHDANKIPELIGVPEGDFPA